MRLPLGAHVSRDRQRRSRVLALWHLQADASQVAAPLPGGGEEGLRSQSRRPLTSPNRKVSDVDRATILRLRAEHKGARRIQNELRLHEQRALSLATIHKVLCEASVKPLVRPRRPAQPKRYSRPVPGDCVQMDTMKIARGVYQYTAIDDCSRFRVLAVYPRRNARNTLLFLDRVIEEMPFPIQRIQTDRGGEFFAESVQRRLMNECIEFRPIPPRSPHLNGKVERSQLTDRNEFWSHHAPTEQARQSTCESKSGSSTTTGLGHTAHSVERLLLTALRSWVESHPSRKRWKMRTTSGKSEFGTANGGSTSSSANIIGGRRNPCRLSAPRVPTRQKNGLQESETMSANRTAELRMVSRPLRGQRAHRTLEAAPQRAQAPQRASLSTSGW